MRIAIILISMAVLPVAALAADAAGLELFKKAQDAFRAKRYREARETLIDLVAKYPAEEYVPRAQLLLAGLERDFQTSLDRFRSLAGKYAGIPEGEEALKSMANRYFVADRHLEASEAYRSFLKQYPKSPHVPEVRFYYASSLMVQGKTDEAVKEFERTAKQAPDSLWAPKSLLGIGTAALKRKKPGDAKKVFLRILDEYPLFDGMNLVYYRLGQSYEMLREAPPARAAYATLVAKYPKALEADDARARMRALDGVGTPPASAPVARKEEGEGLPEAPVPEVKVKEESAGTPFAVRKKPFHVQVGVFTRKENAEKLVKKCSESGLKASIVVAQTEDMPYPYYKVRIGDHVDRAEAQKAAKSVSEKLGQTAIVVED